MTEQEAIKINGWTFEETVKTAENLMESEKNMFKWDVLRHLRDFAELFFEELMQYREIDTIKGYKRTIEVSKENYRLYLEYKAKVKTYETIGTPEECRAAVEKQMAKKVIDNMPTDDDVWYQCSTCKGDLTNIRGFHCPYCGQKLNWSDEE